MLISRPAKRSLKILLLLLPLAASGAALPPGVSAPDSSQHSGDVWGTWTVDDSPHYIVGDVRVPPDSSLTIEAGCEVLFQGYYQFVVDSNAVLLAVGTATDSILFDEVSAGVGWHGIRLLGASSASTLSYCRIQHGKATGYGEDAQGVAVYCDNSRATISNNTFTQNSAFGGSVIYCTSRGPTITGNTFTSNSGGAIVHCDFSSLDIAGNTFTSNSSLAIECGNSGPAIIGNTFASNSNSSSLAGAIYCHNSSNPTIRDNTFTSNAAWWGGGAIYCNSNSNPVITENTFSFNSADYYGGAILCESHSDPAITGNTFISNSTRSDSIYSSGGAIVCDYYSNPIIAGNSFTSNSTGAHGGAIFCTDHSNPTITDNTFASNVAGKGGAVSCNFANPIISNNVFTSNSAEGVGDYGDGHGGAIFCYASNPKISSNTFTLNWTIGGYYSFSYGGAISLEGSDPSIVHNTFTENHAYADAYFYGAGGAIHCGSYSSPTIMNNTFTSNSADNDGGAIYCSYPSSTAITNSILWDDRPNEIYGSPVVTYSDVEGGWPGEGNITVDPKFVNRDADNLNLRSSSPCIDAGDPSSPLDPDGTRADMGALYFDRSVTPSIELYPQGTPIELPPEGGDVTYDGWVYNLADTAITVDVWTYAIVPGIGRFGPVEQYTDVRIRAEGMAGQNNIGEWVPSRAPGGDYTYIGYVGEFGTAVYDSSYFTFGKGP